MLPRLNDANFESAIRSRTPILVTFTAPGRCPRCVEQKVDLEKLAELGVPCFVVDIEQPDSQMAARAGGGERGQWVPYHRVYANGQSLQEKMGKRPLDELKSIFLAGMKAMSSPAVTLQRFAASFGR